MNGQQSSRPEPFHDKAAQTGLDRAALRSGAALRELINRHRRKRSTAGESEQSGPSQSRRAGQPLDLRPGCVYGVVTRERVDDLTNELREIKARINYLFSLVAGAIIIDVLLRISGLG